MKKLLGFCSLSIIFFPIYSFLKPPSSGGAFLSQIGVFVAKTILFCLQLVHRPLISIRSLMLIILGHVESISHLHRSCASVDTTVIAAPP